MFRKFSRKHAILAFGGVFALFFAIYSFQGEKGFVRLGEMLRERNELLARVGLLERENAKLAEEVGRLREDPATIEALARLRLNMVRPGEVVFVFSPELEGARP